MKTILSTLIALLLVSAGLAWANADDVTELAPAPVPEIEQPQQVEDEAESEELTLEKLLAMDPDQMDADACCFAECWEQFDICTQGCSTQACFNDCRDERQACTAGC